MRGIALAKTHVVQSSFLSTARRCGDGRSRCIATDHFARLPDQIRRQEGDVASAASDVKHTHASNDAGFLQKLSCDRLKQARLQFQARYLAVGVAKNVRWITHVGVPI